MRDEALHMDWGNVGKRGGQKPDRNETDINGGKM